MSPKPPSPPPTSPPPPPVDPTRPGRHIGPSPLGDSDGVDSPLPEPTDISTPAGKPPPKEK